MGEVAGCAVSTVERFEGLGVAVCVEARLGSSSLQWVLFGFSLALSGLHKCGSEEGEGRAGFV